MSDAQEPGQVSSGAQPRAEATPTAKAGDRSAPGNRTSAATRYWGGVAAAGRSAKPAVAPAEVVSPSLRRGARS